MTNEIPYPPHPPQGHTQSFLTLGKLATLLEGAGLLFKIFECELNFHILLRCILCESWTYEQIKKKNHF